MRENKEKIASKLPMILLGVLLGLLLCEFILQVGSFFIKDELNSGNFKKPGNVKILCVGDSSTYGLGALKGKSYPDFLAKNLNASITKKKFEVVNLGKPGLNTAMLAKRLDEVLEVFQPHVLIVMTGANDKWNLSGLFQDHEKSALGILWSVLERSKAYKLMRIAWFNLHNGFDKGYFNLTGLPKDMMDLLEFKGMGKEEIRRKISFAMLMCHADEYRVRRDYNNAVILLFYARGLGVCNYLVYEQLSQILIDLSDYHQGVSICLAWKKHFPEDAEINLRLGALYKAVQDYEKSHFYFSQALGKEPDNIEAKKGIENAENFLSMLLFCKMELDGEEFSLLNKSYKDAFLYSEDDGVISLRWHGKEKFIFNENDFAQFMAVIALRDGLDIKQSVLEQKEYFNSLYLEKAKYICELAQKRNISLIFLGYPRQVYDYIKKAADQYNVVFLDLRQHFNEKVNRDNWRKFFILDGHCTALSYEIIGKTVADEILKQFN